MSGADNAEALMRGALARIGRGDWAGAAGALEQAATLHAAGGRADEEARCLLGAATLRRAAGDAGAAGRLAGRAEAAAPASLPVAVAALAERATGEAAQGKSAAAAASFGEAVGIARQAGLPSPALVALLRGRAGALIDAGDFAGADGTLREACGLSDARIGGFLRAEHARRLIDAGHPAEAAPVLPDAGTADAQLRAEILVERARLARIEGNAATARALAAAARDSAVEATAPVQYLGACVELAEAEEALGDRVAAYGVLARAWGGLSDLLGRDVARSWVEPCLLAQRLRWGDAPFAAAKAAYEARRRAAPAEADAP